MYILDTNVVSELRKVRLLHTSLPSLAREALPPRSDTALLI